MTKVLVVDDERKMRRLLQILLERMGIDSVAAESGEEALRCFQAEKIDLILTDLKMPGMTGLELLAKLRELDADVPVILLTAFGTVQTAVDAMKLGAFDYVLKPFDLEAVELIIRKSLEMRQYRTDNRYLRERVQQAPAFERLVGGSAAMEAVYELIRRIGPTRSAVLLTGETGTGKELVARAIHGLSPRRERLFVPLNCAAIPADLLETELFGHTRGAFTGAQSDRTGKFELAGGGPRAGHLPAARAACLARERARAPEPNGARRRSRRGSGDRAGLLPPAPAAGCRHGRRASRGNARARAGRRGARAQAHPARPE